MKQTPKEYAVGCLTINCLACDSEIKVTSYTFPLCKGCLEAIKQVKTELEKQKEL